VQIVVLTTWFPSARNPAAGSFIARDAVALAQDHDVRIVHLAGPDLDDGVRDFSHEGVPVRRFPIDVRRPGGWLASRRLRAALLDGTEILHTMASPSLLPFIDSRPKIGWVHTEHWSGVVNLAGSGRSRFARPLSRRAFAGPDEVVAVSEYLAGAVRTLRDGPVSVIGNIVDAPQDSDDTARSSDDRVRLLAVGTVKSNKGWRLALSALAELRERGVDAELTWLGDGTELDELRTLAEGLPVHAPGHVAQADVRAAMRAADVLLLPTTAETFSLVTVEALSAGLPVVATGEGAHTEFLTPGSGLVVARTSAALASAVLSLQNTDRRIVLARGRELVENFSEARFRSEYTDVYERVVKR